MQSKQRRSIARMVQRVEMSGWQDTRERFMFQGRRLDDDGARGDGREMNMCALPLWEGRGSGRMGIDESRAREEAVMMRSNTRHVTQDGLDTRGLFT